MKTLYLLRHAKSSWDDTCLLDFDRTLSSRGKRDALLMGGIIKYLAIKPDMILCSTSKRTRSTIKRICMLAKRNKETFHYENSIYEASSQSLYSLVQSQDNCINSLCIIGHNPGLTELFQVLVGGEITEIKTAGLAKIVFDAEQRSDCCQQSMKSYSYLDPKKIFAIVSQYF